VDSYLHYIFSTTNNMKHADEAMAQLGGLPLYLDDELDSDDSTTSGDISVDLEKYAIV